MMLNTKPDIEPVLVALKTKTKNKEVLFIGIQPRWINVSRKG